MVNKSSDNRVRPLLATITSGAKAATRSINSGAARRPPVPTAVAVGIFR
jgi:hypothetical protein